MSYFLAIARVLPLIVIYLDYTIWDGVINLKIKPIFLFHVIRSFIQGTIPSKIGYRIAGSSDWSKCKTV